MREIPELPVATDTNATSINKPIITANLIPAMKNQGFSYANMGFKGNTKYWETPEEYWAYTLVDATINEYRGFGLSPAITDSPTYTTDNLYGYGRYNDLPCWCPTIRPVRRAKGSLEDTSISFQSKQQELTEGWFFVEMSAVAHCLSVVATRKCFVKFNLALKRNNDVLDVLPYVQELEFSTGNLGEDVAWRFHEKTRVIPVILDITNINEWTALQASISYATETGDGDLAVLLYSAIQEAPLVNPSTYEGVGSYTSYYGDEWITEPVVNKLWSPGDPLSTAYTRQLAPNDKWNQDGISGAWGLISSVGNSTVTEENETFCSATIVTGQRFQTNPNINKNIKGFYLGCSFYIDSISTNNVLFEGLNTLGASLFNCIMTSAGLLFLGIDNNGTFSSINTGILLPIDEWFDLSVAVIEEQDRKYSGKEVIIYVNGKRAYTTHITRFGDGTDILRSMSISRDSTFPIQNAKVALPHLIVWDKERYPKTFSERDCERLNATFRHMMTGITFDY